VRLRLTADSDAQLGRRTRARAAPTLERAVNQSPNPSLAG
jgi:hypothetical protein